MLHSVSPVLARQPEPELKVEAQPQLERSPLELAAQALPQEPMVLTVLWQQAQLR